MSLFEEQDPEILAIREWARTTETGSRTDLSFFPSEESWSRVCSEADACLGLRCSHREGCFVLKARREASSAQVLVANHHLLFSDLAFRLAGSGFDDPAVLPPFRRVVFDEAHNIEKAATSFFSQSFSRFALQRFLGRLHRRVGGGARGGRGGGDALASGEAGSGRGRVRGHIAALSRLLGRNALTGKAPRLVDDIREEAQELDAACLELMGEESALLLDSSSLAGFIDRVGPSLAALAGSIRRLGELFDELLEKVSEKNPPQETQNIVWDCKVQLARLSGIADLCDRFRLAEPGRNDIFWLETIKGESVRFVVTPLDIGPLMKEAVFEPIRTAVFTSATLTVSGSFSFWAGRIGLDRPWKGNRFSRPFRRPSTTGKTCFSACPRTPPRRIPRATSRFLPVHCAGTADQAVAPVLCSSPRIPCFEKPSRRCNPCSLRAE